MALSYRILLTLLNLFCSGLCVLSNFYLADYPSQLPSSNLVHDVCWLSVDDSTPPSCGIDQQRSGQYWERGRTMNEVMFVVVMGVIRARLAWETRYIEPA
ncbi:hypothetical protein BJ546DRAFT_1082473 [Cryomyces antarcticus]